MRDIRRPYHNLSSRDDDIEKERLKRVEAFEMDDYDDMEYVKDKGPIMRASSHFDLNGVSKNKKDGFDVLKREKYFAEKNAYRKENFGTLKTKRVKPALKYSLITFFIAILIGGFYSWTSIFNSATIKVTPKYKLIDINQTFDIDQNLLFVASSTEISEKVIPKSAPKQMNSKASGEIIIYNNFSNSPQKLVKGTRFQTADNKIFRIVDSVTVPGKISDIPGSIKVKVSADTYGSEYNIPPTDFSIPGFKGTPRFSGFYAKSFNNMYGGASGIVTIVAPEDILSAKNDLSNKNNQKLISNIKSLDFPEYIGFKESPIYFEEDNSRYLLNPENNKYILTSVAKVIFIKKSDIAALIAKDIMGDQYVSTDTFRIDDVSQLSFTLANNTKLEPGQKINILVSGKTKLIWDYSAENIKSSLSSKKVSDFTEIMKTFSNSLSSFSYKLNPSWQRYFPSDIKRINVEEVLN